MVRNLDPILAHVLSSSTSRICGFLPRHMFTSCSFVGGVICDGASVWMLGLLRGRLYGMLLMWSAWKGSMPVVCPTGYTMCRGSFRGSTSGILGPGWANMAEDEPAESAGDPFWLYAIDSLSSSLSAWTSGDTPLRISLARRNSGAGSSPPSGKKPIPPVWKFWPVWPEWLDWAE
jgi:hypothetical protein